MTNPILTRTRVLQVLQYCRNTGTFTWKAPPSPRCKVGSPAGNLSHTGYRRVMIDGIRYQEHRVVWLVEHGTFPLHDLDHVNRIRHDNRIQNLRIATRKQNNENSSLRKDNCSGLRGVSWNQARQKWVAQIGHQHQRIHLGFFDDKDAAHLMYLSAASTLFTHHANT